jgi:hypothetical protein
MTLKLLDFIILRTFNYTIDRRNIQLITIKLQQLINYLVFQFEV